MTDLQSEFAATFVDELALNGISHVVICPGKRSTLFAAAFERHEQIRTHVVVDERSAGFFALGLAKTLGKPVALWCTSGTAAAEFHPAVLEASYSRVPLLVCTADRPPETHAIRDWQSMDQTHLYGRAARWFFDFGVADAGMKPKWRAITSRACIESVHNASGPGPVHLNIPIREPIDVGRVHFSLSDNEKCTQPAVELKRAGRPAPDEVVGEILERARAGQRGAFVVGTTLIDAQVVVEASTALGWPVFAHPRSVVWGRGESIISAFDVMLADEAFRTKMKPDFVVHVGDPILAANVSKWAESAEQWSVETMPSWQGATAQVSRVVEADATLFFERLALANVDGNWLSEWQTAETKAQGAIDAFLVDETDLSEPAIARTLLSWLPNESNLFCSTSMPVRDVDWWSQPRKGVRVFANRGVSGLDGVTSTAMGMAVAEPHKTNVLLVGDLGLLHDLNALWAFRSSNPRAQLTIVVVDNDGGGIFAGFPMAKELEPEIYEKVVATPQSVDIVSVASALGADVTTITALDELSKALDASGIRVVYCKTDVNKNQQVVRSLKDAVKRALQ